MSTYLDAIIRHHRRRASADGRPLADLLVGQSFVGAGGLAAAGQAVADLVAAGR